MKKLLIITNKLEDVHADFMIEKFNQKGLQDSVIRLNTEDFLTNPIISFRDGDMNIFLRDSKRKFNSKDIGCVWYRRPETIKIPDDYIDGARQYVKEEINHILKGLYYCLPDSAFWINPRKDSDHPPNKLKQIQLARKIGFKVPRTIITNSVQEANKFITQVNELCIKALRINDFLHNEEIYYFFTTKITKGDFHKYAEDIEVCPILLQEFIPKIYDLRVIVMGSKIHAIEIHSQEKSESRPDFRIIAPNMLNHKVHQLPNELCDKIREFMAYYNLAFSAFDFAVTANGDYFFLENNPNGQWLWLEKMTGEPLSESLMELMLTHM